MLKDREAAAQPLVERLVSDAETQAAAGRVREALVLLRWASRISPDGVLPVVLLAFHRLRAARPRAAAVPNIPAPPRGARMDVNPGAEGLPSDALGFPVPRFPTARPVIDADGFVPAPLGVAIRRVAPAEPAFRPTPAPRRAALAPVLLVAAAAALVLAPQGEMLMARFRSFKGPAEPGAVALKSGDPGRALSETAAVGRTPPVLLLRGGAFLALGDTAAALASLDSAAANPEASADEARQAAELLGRLPGGEDSAADAYLRAFEAGLAREHWGAAAEALERAGRSQQARRLRDLSEQRAGAVAPTGVGSRQ